MGVFFAGDVNLPQFSGTVFFSQIGAGLPAVPTSGDFCDINANNFLGNKFESGECAPTGDFLGNRFESGFEPPNPPVSNVTSDSQFTTYCGPTHESACSFKNDFYTYDQLNREYIARGSPRIIIYKLNRETTDVDPLTGEARYNEFFKKGVVVQGKITLNPIIQELNRFGITEDEDLIVEFNYGLLVERLGRPVLKGDLMVVYLTTQRITENMLKADQLNQDLYVRQTRKIYRVNTSVPKDVFLWNYLTIEINAVKTNLDTEIVETNDWDDVYELNEVPPDVETEDPNPVPLNI